MPAAKFLTDIQIEQGADLYLKGIAAAGSDFDMFAVLDSSTKKVMYRTGAQVSSDLGLGTISLLSEAEFFRKGRGGVLLTDIDTFINRECGTYVVTASGASHQLTVFKNSGGSSTALEIYNTYGLDILQIRTTIDSNRYSPWYTLWHSGNLIDNHVNWDEAHGWGPHSGLYTLLAHTGAGGSAHANAIAAGAAGFMTGADKTKLDGISAGATALVLGTTSTTAFRGDYGNTAFNYSQVGHLPSAGGSLSGPVTSSSQIHSYALNVSYAADGLFHANARPSTVVALSSGRKIVFGYQDDGQGTYNPAIGIEVSHLNGNNNSVTTNAIVVRNHFLATNPFRVTNLGDAYIRENLVWHAGNFTDNHISWDEAHNWGNHASAGYSASGHNHSGIYDPAGTGHTEAGAHVTAHESAFTHANIANGQTAFGWGNHSGLYLPLGGGTMSNTNLVTNLNANYLGNYSSRNYAYADKMAYSSVTGDNGTDAWYTLFQVQDSTNAPITCNVRAYAHSSATFIVSKGYGISADNNSLITIIHANTGSCNGGYKYIKGVRITEAGNVQIKLNAGAIVSVLAQITSNGLSIPALESTLIRETGSPIICDAVDPLANGSIRTNGGIYASGGTSSDWNEAHSWGSHSGLYTLLAHTGAGGSAHANAIAAGASGFMTGADKTKLDGITAGATALVLGTTSSTAFRGDYGNTAYNYSQVGHLPLAGGTITGHLYTNYNSIVLNPIGGSITTNGFFGLFWHNQSGSPDTTYAIHRTAGVWTGPDYQQLRIAWDTGIVIDGGSAYGKSGLSLQPGGGGVSIGSTSNYGYKFCCAGTAYFSGVVTSIVSTGTAPFSIASATVNANLNADLLDGQHASAFAPSSTVSFPGFGTTGTTACVGNDGRLADSRSPLSHTLIGHTVSGLTTGHFLKATGAATFGFAAHGLFHTYAGGTIDTNPVSWLSDDTLSGTCKMIAEFVTHYAAPISTVSFPGFGTTNVLAAYGNHTHTGYASITGASGFLTSNGSSWVWDATVYSVNGHGHGNILSGGYLGSTASIPLITGSGGKIEAGSFGTAAGTFCVGNDARLSDARTPTSHNHSTLYDPIGTGNTEATAHVAAHVTASHPTNSVAIYSKKITFTPAQLIALYGSFATLVTGTTGYIINVLSVVGIYDYQVTTETVVYWATGNTAKLQVYSDAGQSILFESNSTFYKANGNYDCAQPFVHGPAPATNERSLLDGNSILIKSTALMTPSNATSPITIYITYTITQL